MTHYLVARTRSHAAKTSVRVTYGFGKTAVRSSAISLRFHAEREVAAGCLITIAEIRMAQSVKVEEHIHGGTVWVAIRARGAEWSWLTQEEAARLGREWAARYGSVEPEHTPLLAAE
jgi:hypothetical protein